METKDKYNLDNLLSKSDEIKKEKRKELLLGSLLQLLLYALLL